MHHLSPPAKASDGKASQEDARWVAHWGMWGVTPAMKIGTFRHQKKEGFEPRNMEVSPTINEQMWNSPMNSFGCV